MTLMIITGSAFADLASYHQEMLCSLSEVLSKIGNDGECGIAIKQRNYEARKGACFGKFDRNLNCFVGFETKGPNSNVRLKCGAGNIDRPIFDKTLKAESAYYNVSALIKTAEGRKLIMTDPNNHVYYSNDLILLYLVENENKEIEGEVILKLENNGVGLKDLECTYF